MSLFLGFPRRNGRPGIRNHLLLLSICGLNTQGARNAVQTLSDAVIVTSAYGRGQVGADKYFHQRMLTAFATHPNVGAVLVFAPDDRSCDEIGQIVIDSGRKFKGFSLQNWGEDGSAMTAAATKEGQRLLNMLKKVSRKPCLMSDILIAAECGHSDASSGIVSNPLVGDLFDHHILAGGAALFSETLEWLGCEPSLYERCVSKRVSRRLRTLVEERHKITKSAEKNMFVGNPGPQNYEGGITTLEEKSLGSISKGGSQPISGALAAGESVSSSGLHLMDTPTLSPESISSMVAAGAQIVCFTTGHGNPYGSALAPTIKLTANPQTAKRLPNQIDFDASDIFCGALTRKDMLPKLIKLLTQVCEGKITAAEINREGDEVISRLGPSV